MEIVNTAILDIDKAKQAWLAKNGVEVGLDLQVLDFKGKAVQWKSVEPKLREWGAVLHSMAVFDDDEIAAAPWVVVTAAWEWGYPVPYDRDRWLGVTYDLRSLCKVCGVGARQRDPFRLKKAPRWRRKNALCLIGIYDELFVSDRLAAVFREFGVECGPVANSSGSVMLEDIWQVIPCGTAKVLIEEGAVAEVCDACGRRRWELSDWICRWAPEVVQGEGHCLVSDEWMGTGADGRRWLYLSGELRRAIEEIFPGSLQCRPVRVSPVL